MIGGWLVAALGWRSVFLVVVPVSAVSIVLIAARTAEIPRHAATRPDLPGQLLAARTGLLAVAVALGACFAVVEHRVSEPMLPPALFRSSAFSGATGVGLLFNYGLYGVLFCITIFLERTLRQSTAVTGAALLPLTAVTALSALFSGRVTNRFGPRVPMVLGLCRPVYARDDRGRWTGSGRGTPASALPRSTPRARPGARWASPCSAASRCSGPVRQARIYRTCGCP